MQSNPSKGFVGKVPSPLKTTVVDLSDLKAESLPPLAEFSSQKMILLTSGYFQISKFFP
jgi:hypothetical protein